MTGDGECEISSEMVESFLEESQSDYKETTELEYLTEREADYFLSNFIYNRIIIASITSNWKCCFVDSSLSQEECDTMIFGLASKHFGITNTYTHFS